MERDLPSRPKGLTKSESGASFGGGSAMSVPVLGSHPLGTLHVHQVTETHEEEDDDDDGPPPLDPPSTQDESHSNSVYKASQHDSSKSFHSPTWEPLTHNLGGGDVVLILDLPEVFTVGYDSISFTAKHFGGIRDIPPGAHFFWVAHPGGLSARCGFWVVANNANTVHVMQWDRFNEVLGDSARAEARIQADNLETIHSKLVPYQDPTAVNAASGDLTQAASERNFNMWEQLTGKVSEGLLNRVTGQNYDNWTVHTGDRVKGSVLMAAEMELDNSLSNPMLKSRELNFAFSQRTKTYSTDNTGAERTLEATDATPYILSLVDASDNDLTSDDLVGEFQFSFVVGVHLGNDSCIQQWWHMLLKIFLRAHLLPARRPSLAAAFIRTLAAQLTYSASWLEGSILDSAESQTRDLRLALTVYKRRLEELMQGLGNQATPEQLSVATAFAGLEAVATDTLDWDLRGDYLRRGNVMMEDGEEVELEDADMAAEDERGEWAPEIVDLDESGRQRDLVSWND
ncbi:AAR2 protein-domain-containing protein [Fusarium flagelliforme]|uniref:AAR2 protein-domain-containing protein n=1 Tax=Fusarium flagelliforme TaxID=2675880 RepID=UPI001E8CE8F5|nr:AAR2 protein-domain-containing protein [Fusarium flagelliforme]KAH7173479.1 AAR2 protein-domain-containing protein [Fusarium flagelliforme]